jgi:hypothetical protein
LLGALQPAYVVQFSPYRFEAALINRTSQGYSPKTPGLSPTRAASSQGSPDQCSNTAPNNFLPHDHSSSETTDMDKTGAVTEYPSPTTANATKGNHNDPKQAPHDKDQGKKTLEGMARRIEELGEMESFMRRNQGEHPPHH